MISPFKGLSSGGNSLKDSLRGSQPMSPIHDKPEQFDDYTPDKHMQVPTRNAVSFGINSFANAGNSFKVASGVGKLSFGRDINQAPNEI